MEPKKVTCKRCGASWQPKSDKKPVQCARCHSVLWDTEYKQRRPGGGGINWAEEQDRIFSSKPMPSKPVKDPDPEKTAKEKRKLAFINTLAKWIQQSDEEKRLAVGISSLAKWEAAKSGELLLSDENIESVRQKLEKAFGPGDVDIDF